MTTTVLKFGTTTSPPVKHSVGSGDIPSSFYRTAVDAYDTAKADLSNILPDIPNPMPGDNDIPFSDIVPNITVTDLRSALSHFSPSVDVWYNVSPGNCDDLEAVKITKVDDKAVDLETAGGSWADLEVSISASYKIIAHDPFIKEDAPCPTDDYADWLEEMQEFIVARQAYEDAIRNLQELSEEQMEIISEGYPEAPGGFTGERFELEGKQKTRKFEIYWYITITVLKFVYTAEVHKQTHYVCTEVCC